MKIWLQQQQVAKLADLDSILKYKYFQSTANRLNETTTAQNEPIISPNQLTRYFPGLEIFIITIGNRYFRGETFSETWQMIFFLQIFQSVIIKIQLRCNHVIDQNFYGNCAKKYCFFFFNLWKQKNSYSKWSMCLFKRTP